ncbi:MAG: hypothetical protein ACRDKI_12710 [Solirubrobacterales bacterium]
MRCACIDVGSNTTALLVADLDADGLVAVATRRRFTLIGDGAGPDGIIDAKIDEAEAAAHDLAEYARETGAEQICAVATHVVREAPNGDAVAERIGARLGLPVEVLDGHTEARFSFIGATGGMHRVRRPTVVIDSGGGSTEVTHCAPGGEPTTATFAVGSAAIQARFLPDDPPTDAQLATARDYVEQAFADLAPVAERPLALVVGGGASTAQAILGGVIDRAGTDRVLAHVTAQPAEQLAQKFGIEFNRARLLPASLLVLGSLADHLGVELEVGRGGLREGVLIDRYGAK